MGLLFFKWIQNNIRIFQTLLVCDIAVVMLHFLFGTHTPFFHLDLEQNFPTAYQSTKLIVFALLFLVLSCSKKLKSNVKSFIFPLGLFLTFWGLDEALQIHENIYRIFEFLGLLHPSRVVDVSLRMGYKSSLWLLYYSPLIFIFVFWCGYWLRYFQSKMKSNFWIIGLSSMCLFTILLAEVLSSTGIYSEAAYYWLVTIEEMAEMLLATTLIFVGNKMLTRYSSYTG